MTHRILDISKLASLWHDNLWGNYLTLVKHLLSAKFKLLGCWIDFPRSKGNKRNLIVQIKVELLVNLIERSSHKPAKLIRFLIESNTSLWRWLRQRGLKGKAKQPTLPRLLVSRILFYLLTQASFIPSRAKISVSLLIILNENRWCFVHHWWSGR